jgi:hypothetical protein
MEDVRSSTSLNAVSSSSLHHHANLFSLLHFLSSASRVVPPCCAEDARCDFCRHPPHTYSTPYPVAFCSNANGMFVPGPDLLPMDAQDVNGFGCSLYNILYVDFFGEFGHILFGIEAAVNTIISLIDPAFICIVCSSNFPTEA